MPRFPFICLLAASPLTVGGCDRQSVPKEQVQPAAVAAKPPAGLESANGLRAELTYRFAGRQAPAETFLGADGREVALNDFAGKPLLVNLWATWCAPCKIEMPTLDALADLEADRLTVIAVSQDLKGRAPVQAFFKSANIGNLEPFTDQDNHLLGAIGGGPNLPTTILYDSKGREVWRVVGGLEWDDEEVAKLLGEAN